jgi:hypothetical protein
MTENEWKTYRTRFLIKAKQLNSNLSFTDALGRQHCGRKGDYLVESFEGVLSIAPRQIFEDIYVPMSGVPAEPLNTGTISLPDLPAGKPSQPAVEAFDLNALAQPNFPRRRRSDPPAPAARRKSPQPVRTPRVSTQLGLM